MLLVHHFIAHTKTYQRKVQHFSKNEVYPELGSLIAIKVISNDDPFNKLQLSEETSISKDDQPPDKWEFPRHKLRIFNIVGEGAFGQVWRAQALDIAGK